MKKRLAAFTALIIAAQVFVSSFAYAQSPSDWAADEVNSALESGLVPQSVMGSYQESITREEFCETVMLTYTFLGGEYTGETEVTFVDTDNPEIIKAASIGIVDGYGDGVFAPDDLVTREQIAVMLVRMIDKAVEDEDVSVYESCSFPDESEISDWALSAVSFMFDNGIMQGVDSLNSIDPKANTTCEQAIILAYRVSRLYGNMLSRDDFSGMFELDNEVKNAADQYKESSGYIDPENIDSALSAVESAAESLKNEGIVTDYSNNSGTVWIKLSSGIEYVYLPEEEGIDLGGTDMTITTLQPFNTWYLEERPDSGDHERGERATDGSAEKIASELDEYSFVNNYDDEQVTLDTIKNFGENQVILWHGHGGYNTKTHSFLVTGVPLDEEAFLLDPIYYIKNAKYTVDYLSGSIVCTNLGRIAVTYKYIDDNIGSLENSFIYLGACETGKDTYLVNSFLGKGAEAVVGNSDSIETKYNQNMIMSVCNGLITKDDNNNYMTLTDAMEYAFDINGASDSNGAYPIIFGDGDIRLSETNGITFSSVIGEVNGRIYCARNNIPTCEYLPIETPADRSIASFCYYDGYVYYIVSEGGTSDYSTWLYRCKTDWTENELLADMISDPVTGYSVGNRMFIIDDDVLYYGTSRKVTAIDLKTMEQSEKTVPSYTAAGNTYSGSAKSDYSGYIAIYNDTVFYTDDRNLYMITDEGESRLLASDAYIDGGMACGYLYYSVYNYENYNEATLCRINLSTGATEELHSKPVAGGGGPYFNW